MSGGSPHTKLTLSLARKPAAKAFKRKSPFRAPTASEDADAATAAEPIRDARDAEGAAVSRPPLHTTSSALADGVESDAALAAPSTLDAFLADLPNTTAVEATEPGAEDGGLSFADSSTLEDTVTSSSDAGSGGAGSGGAGSGGAGTGGAVSKTRKLDKVGANYKLHAFIKQTLEAPAAADGTASALRALRGIRCEFDAKNGGPAPEAVDIPPITTWHAASLPLPMMRVLNSQGYSEPTPIQAQALPIIMHGRDMLGIAPTGSGKTAAILIPLCRHVAANLENYRRARSKAPFGLVLVPTRELCVQVHSELAMWARSVELEVLAAYGGSDIGPQIAALVSGRCHVVVATPGRLIDLLTANNGRVMSLAGVTFLAIDETDRMFDLGFGPQVRKIMDSIRPDRQLVIFSATMPKALEGIVERNLRNPAKVSVTVPGQGDGEPSASTYSISPNIAQSAYVLADAKEKLEKLVGLIKETAESSFKLVFVNTQASADTLSLQLASANVQSQPLHGGMDQADRDSAISEFRNGLVPVLVATSVAARGLDVKNLKLVVNYDPASHLEDYVHRAGRTGRAGDTGKCVSLLLPSQSREAWFLTKFFVPDRSVQDLAAVYAQSQAANEESKTSKWRGFGGQGLARLDTRRNHDRAIEREVYASTQEPASRQSTPNKEEKMAKRSDGDNGLTARLPVNDIAREARLAVTAAALHAELAQKYHVSLTLKGMYLTASRSKVDEAQKLHIQIEGSDAHNVAAALEELKQVVTQKEAGARPTGKYSAF